MAYAIMRCKKLTTMSNVANSLKHCHRERETPNADPSRTPENAHMAARSADEAMGRLRELLPEKRRKDAVLAVEYVMTASPEWWKQASREQQETFFVRSHAWLANKYGQDRIITATVHRDELTPHLSAFVVPLTHDGRLSAKAFTGGRAQLSRDQSSFAAAVADLGLQRGIEGSRATHTRVKSFYGALEHPPVEHVAIPAELLKPRQYKRQGVLEHLRLITRMETPEEVAERVTRAVQASYAPAVEMAANARETAQKAAQAQKTAQDLRNRLKPVVEAFSALKPQNQKILLDITLKTAAKVLEHQKQQQTKAKRVQSMERSPARERDKGMSR